MRRLMLLWCATAVLAQTPVKPVTEWDGADLVLAYPDLAGLRFADSQQALPPLLERVGDSTERMLTPLPAVAPDEEIHELRFDRGGGVTERTEKFRYVMRYARRGTETVLDEFRTLPGSEAPAPPPQSSGYLVLNHFEGLLEWFLPEARSLSEFRLAGRMGGGVAVVVFAQRAGTPLRSPVVVDSSGRTARLHGVVWIDEPSGRILRVRAEMADRVARFPLETVAVDVRFATVKDAGWVPSRVTVHGRFDGGEVHAVHRYSAYQIDDGPAGRAVADTAQDGYETLARGIRLEEAHRLEEAAAVLRESVRLDPSAVLARFHLATILDATGDARGAEEQMRNALRQRPADGAGHHFLAVVLTKEGNLAGAAEEFRAAARLQPKNATVQFHLGQVLEKTGDTEAAAEAYRAAAALEPASAEYRAAVERVESKGQPALRVDVRQVLVPVIAQDRDGHSMSGLKQADFQVWEDGVEQTITSFAAESTTGVSVDAAGAPVEAAPVPAETTGPVPVRRTYVFCIDTLHTTLSGLTRARGAVEQVVRAERAGDAQYVLVAVGSSTDILVNTTRDPAPIAEALEAKRFQSHLLDSRRGAQEVDLAQFIRSLDEALNACAAGDPSCPGRKRLLPLEAARLALQERVYNQLFLRQLRDLVEQLSHGTDRRTVVLISDGFDLVPGRVEHMLLTAYFPEFRFEALSSVERMQGEFEQVVRLAAKSNVTIHTVDARGLFTDGAFQASSAGGGAAAMPGLQGALHQGEMALQDALVEMAAATGGLAYRNNNDLARGVERAVADGRAYYVLGYVPANAKMDGRFRAIQVRVRERGVVLRAKRGYWATGP